MSSSSGVGPHRAKQSPCVTQNRAIVVNPSCEPRLTERGAPHRETAQAPLCRFGRGLRYGGSTLVGWLRSVAARAVRLYLQRAEHQARPAPPAHGVYRGFRYEKKKRMKPQPTDASDVDKLGDLKGRAQEEGIGSCSITAT
uniref:Uncharacterized protein n=1 Tax=Oryza rufipogon TaxID=4529 RepID=A0A0E0R918_ORYRU